MYFSGGSWDDLDDLDDLDGYIGDIDSEGDPDEYPADFEWTCCGMTTKSMRDRRQRVKDVLGKITAAGHGHRIKTKIVQTVAVLSTPPPPPPPRSRTTAHPSHASFQETDQEHPDFDDLTPGTKDLVRRLAAATAHKRTPLSSPKKRIEQQCSKCREAKPAWCFLSKTASRELKTCVTCRSKDPCAGCMHDLADIVEAYSKAHPESGDEKWYMRTPNPVVEQQDLGYYCREGPCPDLRCQMADSLNQK
ncbi:hypothetical protein B0A49_00262 [Cryomyces minteri]|uniref:Uncharacterized protein n=1 Tax=Cryomyces minteri TaxID=331657 RepID=A0A4U0Y1E7_9PEZI|nr:hypothetical protein B0A49_00262 [Cryomyces minteri]